MRRFVAAVVAVGIGAYAAVGLAPNAQAGSKAPTRLDPGAACADGRPLVVGVRGTDDDKNPTGVGPTVDAAVIALQSSYAKGLDVRYLDYPAASLTDLVSPLSRRGGGLAFVNSVKSYLGKAASGSALLGRQLSAIGSMCPTLPITLIGYSQGALVVNRALVSLAANDDPALGQIAAVELIADPQRLGSSTYDRGDASPDLNGLTVSFHQLPADPLPASVAPAAASWCHAGDIVCAPGASVIATAIAFLTGQPAVVTAAVIAHGIHVHENYTSRGEARAAGLHAAGLLSQFTPRPVGLWTDPSLVIDATSLGAVKVGTSLDQAQTAAGIVFDGTGDGVYFPTMLPTGFAHLFVDLEYNAFCVGASTTSDTPLQQVVRTREGFRLGDTVETLKSIYGSRLTYVPAPTTGISAQAGYVVSEPDGSIAFGVDPDGIVSVITAGHGFNGNALTPSNCIP
jgi:hypothetical protein